MRTTLLLLVLVTLWSVATLGSAQTSIPNCGAFGVDLTPLSTQDLSYNSSVGYVYVLHPCGAITDPGCVADPTSNGAMVCQRGTTDAYSLAKWNTSAVIYSRDRNGIYQQLIDGELCGSTPRQSLIYYQCDPSATTPQLISAAETTTQCVYDLVVLTSLTCALPQEANCVFSGVDFNDMFAEGDLNITTSNGYNWFLHMCGSSFSNAGCRNDSLADTSMICQQSSTDTTLDYSIAVYNESTIQWQIIPTGANAGMQFTVPNGEYCAAALRNRIAVIQMVCDPTLGLESSYIYGVAEVQTCLYQFTVRTPLVCSVLQIGSSSTGSNGIALSSSWWPTSTACTFNGYNLSPMAALPDLHWGGFVLNVYYDFYFHMCGVVSNPQCLSDSSTYNSMFCQASITNAEDNYALDYYVPSRWTWTETQYGLSYTSRLGELCGTTRRTTTVNMICDLGQTRIDSVIEDPVSQCNINVTIKTPYVCDPDGSNWPPQIPQCVFNGWDFKPLSANADLQLFDNGATPYVISMRLCQEVTYTPCKRDIVSTQSMVCQTRIADNVSYSLGDYDVGQQVWTEFTAQNVIQMTVNTGTLCPNNNPRVSVVNFTCNATHQALTGNHTQIISFVEGPECVYNILVVANDVVCPYFNGSGWNLTQSSSSTAGNPAVGNNGIGTGCLSANSIPGGAVAVSLVLNAPFPLLANSIDTTNSQILSGIAQILSITTAQLACGQLTGGRVSNAVNATNLQTIFTFYILPGTQDPLILSQNLGSIIMNNVALLNAVLPPNAPPVAQGPFGAVSCPSGQYPSSDGNCYSRSSGSKLSGGAIAGIVIGTIVGAILLLGLGIWLMSHSKARKGFSSEEGNRGKGVEMQENEHDSETADAETDY